MKGHKLHHETHKKIEHHIAKHRKAGGRAESPMEGRDDAEEDLKSKPERYNNSKVESEAEERKHGGRAKKHKEHHGKMHKEHHGKMHEEHAHKHAGRKPRKSGGSVEKSPFSHAQHMTPARGRKIEKMTEGRDE